jgi:exodeoxyribonuclease VII large subunit
MKIISVSQLNRYIKEKLENDLILRDLWVKGEVSNFKHHSSGHMYFTLKDKAGSLKCVMFRSRNMTLDFLPQEGMAVIVRGYVTVFERDGLYQLYVEEMQPEGIGALYTAYIQLKERLEKEGLFAQSRKRSLPQFPAKVAVVTSLTGAAVRDVITVITRRSPNIHIIVVPVVVQGDSAPAQISEGIRLANEIEAVDIIIVGRGGGSIEELWAFNTELVARSIFHSRVPVISAVGHETDFTIADFVADRRAPTPSAAAELAVPDNDQVKKYITGLNFRLITGIKTRIKSNKDKLLILVHHKLLFRPKDEVQRKMQELDNLNRRLEYAVRKVVAEKKNQLAVAVSQLDGVSPLATLERGFAICTDKSGRTLKSKAGVKPGQTVEVTLTDGSLLCNVEKIKEGLYFGQKKN